uniref:Reverse transcriptase domain-containing protein n=1 Tax=Trichuris muris TaxID=70415 RepID=A0A5S6QFI1_TRIMR
MTLAEEALLAKGMNFVPTPREVDYVDLISRVENGVGDMEQTRADQIRCAVVQCLMAPRYRPVMNLSTKEIETIKALKNEQSIIVTKADKGNVVVILDREDYNNKVTNSLHSENYTILQRDPSESIRKSLLSKVSALFDETKERKMSDIARQLHFTTNFSCPEFYGLPKIHKTGIPLRPVISSRRSVKSSICSFLAKLLKPLVGRKQSHTSNSAEFVGEIRTITLDPGDVMVSYDVKDLFTSIPLDYTYMVIFNLLSEDLSLPDRTKLNPHHITQFVKFCLEEGNFFKWNNSIFVQRRGAPMGSPLSPVVAEIFMEHFEEKAFPLGIHGFHLSVFKRYVDDVFAIVKRGEENCLLDHLNDVLPDSIVFAMEIETEGKLPFLDVLVMRKDTHLTTRVYRKPTNSDGYLNFYSNHPLEVKRGIITGMVDRAARICDEEFLNEELDFNYKTMLLNGRVHNLGDQVCCRLGWGAISENV